MTHLTCDDCHIEIALHADGSLHCSCNGRNYQPARKDWPNGWNDTEQLETLQARELLLAAIEPELRPFVWNEIDEADVMRQAGGDVAKAVALCQKAFDDFTAKEDE